MSRRVLAVVTKRRRSSAGDQFRPNRVKGCRRVPPCAGAGGGVQGASVAPRDNRSALMASGQGQRLRRWHHSINPPTMEPWKPRRRGDTARVDLAVGPQLAAGVGMKHSVRAADGPAATCLARHGSVPRGPLPTLAVAITGAHARHRGPLHDDRLLGTHFPDHEDRRDGGGDRGGDDKPD